MTKGRRILTQSDLNMVVEEMAKPKAPCSWQHITDKPSFSTVAFSGSYNDLSDKPILFSGNYNELSNKPTIPSMPNLDPLTQRVSNLESVTASFVVKFSSGKAASIAPITTSPENVVEVNILGLSLKVGAASSVNSLRNEFIKLRDSHNALLAACKSWGWMAA